MAGKPIAILSADRSGDQHAPGNVHDAGAPAGPRLLEHLEEDTEKSILAEALGFDEVWLGEHFSATTEPIPSPMMFFANLIARTSNIMFGTAVINPLNHHPAIVAAEAAQLDHMSRGCRSLESDRVASFPISSCSEIRRARAQPHGGRSG